MSKIFLSYPVLGAPQLNSLFSVYQAILSCPEHKVRLYANLNDSLISRVRSAHVSSFLHDFPECDYYMSIDSDLEILNAYPNNNIFSKLIAHDLDFVGGLYALKKQGVKRCSSITMDGSAAEFDTGLKEMRWMSSGCWCCRRSVIEKMVKAYPELNYDGDDNMSGKALHALFMPMLYDLKEGDFPNIKLPFRKYLSEDWAFAERWKAIGGKIFADTSVVLQHIGSYNYNLFDVQVVKTQKPNLPPAGFDLPKKE
jgi:hypothetical protein